MHTHKYCCHFSMHDATNCVAQKYKNAELIVYVPSKGSRTDGNLWSTDQLGQNLSRASTIRALLACVHLYKGVAEVIKANMF